MATTIVADVVVITAEGVLAELQQLALEHPGRRASDAYLDTYGRPHCVVAHALHRLGVPLTLLAELDRLHATIDDPAADIVPLPQHARAIARAAQRAQDDGEPWIKAAQSALAEARRLGVVA